MKYLATYLLLIFAFTANAQSITDTIRTYTLPQAEKTATRIVRSRIFYLVTPSKNLNDLLRENTGFYIKSYGNGQLTSLSYRGTAAAQNDVLWNGIKLNSPSLGQVDVSLFNLGLADELRLTGNSETGNVGSSLNILNQNKVDSSVFIQAHFTYGSFNTISTYAQAKFGNGKVMGTTRVGYFHSDNDFSFVNIFKAGSPVEKQTNGKVSMLHFMQQFAAQLNLHHSIFFNVWISDAQRQIPPVMSKPLSKENQDDYSLRSMLTWRGNFRKVKTECTSAYLHDYLRYTNPEIYLDDKSIMQALRNNFSFSFDSLRKFSVKVDAGYEFERAVVPAYISVRQRHIGKLTATVSYEPAKEIMLQVKLREHLYDNILSPFSPALSIRYRQSISSYHTVQLLLNASRNFRFPTLNDLYWVPGGNSDLKTEKSWDGELQASYNYSYYFIFRASGFCKYISDLILWQSNGSYWQPLNVKRVLIRGVEVYTQWNYFARNNFSLNGSINYTYTCATNLDAATPFDQSKGKQLIYVPLNLLKANLKLEWKKLYLRPVFTFTDKVFISTDNSQSLKGYYLFDLELGKDFTIKEDYEIGLAFRVNNVVGVNYQNVAQRAMPGRSFEGTIRFNIRK